MSNVLKVATCLILGERTWDLQPPYPAHNLIDRYIHPKNSKKLVQTIEREDPSSAIVPATLATPELALAVVEATSST